MADYIYMMETRLTPEQQRGVALVQELARQQEMNLYLTGGAIRDMISGFPIRDLDFTVQGNALKLQRDLEKQGAVIQGVDEDLRSLFVLLPGNVRAEIAMARAERYDKPGKPPGISSATIIEDLWRRDFTINAMALSLNPGSRGLLLDPSNGAADIEAKLIRILHNYSFLEEPSRLVRATRFLTRFHWTLEERTQARYAAARENSYIDYISDRAIGHEIEQLGYEDDPLHVLRALEKEGWLKILQPHWTTAKVDTTSLSQLIKARQQMLDLGYSLDAAPAIMHFLTRRLGDREIAAMQKLMPRKSFVETWRRLEDEAKELAKRLSSKEAATPSLAWKLLSASRPETILFLAVTARQQAVAQKIRNFFTRWRQVKDKLPLPEMTELHITPELPVYPELAEQVFLLLLDGKMRSRTEILKFLKPYAPPPPPPPPPPPRRRAKAAEAAAAETVKKGRKPKPGIVVASEVKAAEEKPASPPPAVKQPAVKEPAQAGKKAARPAPKKAKTAKTAKKAKKKAPPSGQKKKSGKARKRR